MSIMFLLLLKLHFKQKDIFQVCAFVVPKYPIETYTVQTYDLSDFFPPIFWLSWLLSACCCVFQVQVVTSEENIGFVLLSLQD